MSKNRNKHKKRQSGNSVKKTSNQIQGFSADQLEDIIASAILKAETQRQKEKEQSISEEKKEWRKQLGIKDFTGKPCYIQCLLEMITFIRILIILPFKNLTPLSSNVYTTGIFTLILTVILLGASMLCIFGTLLIPLLILIRKGITVFTLIEGLVYGLAFYVFGIFFYLSGNEILDTKDSDYVFSAFSATTSIIAIVIAVIALVLK